MKQLERSRQSARECRARKKLRYQYLEELVNHREHSVILLRKELEAFKEWCRDEACTTDHPFSKIKKELEEGTFNK